MAPRPWVPMERASKLPPTPEQVASARAAAVAQGLDPEFIEDELVRDHEMWRNDRYTASVERGDSGAVTVLSIHRNDRKPDMPWRHLQAIKNDIAGPEVEALELFPAESRLVDTANQRWLWCLPPGRSAGFGFTGGRHVSGPDEAVGFGARQAAFP
jgi:hypothetical protein